MQLHARVMSSGLLQLCLHYSYLHWRWFVYGGALNLSESDPLTEHHEGRKDRLGSSVERSN